LAWDLQVGLALGLGLEDLGIGIGYTGIGYE
jgi:hypothetical protein